MRASRRRRRRATRSRGAGCRHAAATLASAPAPPRPRARAQPAPSRPPGAICADVNRAYPSVSYVLSGTFTHGGYTQLAA
jgi:hypothetical protein